MRSAIAVLNFFAMMWAVSAIALSGGPAVLLAAPVAGALLVAAVAARHAAPPGEPGRHAAAWKAVALWSGVELVAIIVAAILLVHFGAPDAIMPAVAIIVGLHFLPLAASVGVPLYRATAAGLIVVGGAALALPPEVRPAAVGLSAATVLWSSCVAMIARTRRAA